MVAEPSRSREGIGLYPSLFSVQTQVCGYDLGSDLEDINFDPQGPPFLQITADRMGRKLLCSHLSHRIPAEYCIPVFPLFETKCRGKTEVHFKIFRYQLGLVGHP